jgi:ERI1 exoribonuclease 2
MRRRKIKEHSYKYLICIDFEATCFEKPSGNTRKRQEIIEFPAVLLNLETGAIEKEFHRYIRAVEIPVLTEYCKNLTGISQELVDQGILLQEVLEEFRVSLKFKKPLNNNSFQLNF